MQNVSAGIRAFLVGGGKARFDGFDRKTGGKQFKVISRTEDEVLREIERSFKAPVKGTNLEFHLSPTITAFSSTFAPSASGVQTLNAPSFLSTLSADFAHALSDLSAVLTDLKKLSTFGDLPVSLANTSLGPIITLRFQGCDADIVSRLCDEAGVRRGIIREDEAWDHDRDVEMALLFPFVSTGTSKGVKEISEDDGICFTREPPTPEQLDWRHMMSPHEFLPSIQSSVSSDPFKSPPSAGYRRPIRSFKSLSGYESLRDSDFADDDPYVHGEGIVASLAGNQHDGVGSEGYEGLQGVFRFLRECEEARR